MENKIPKMKQKLYYLVSLLKSNNNILYKFKQFKNKYLKQLLNRMLTIRYFLTDIKLDESFGSKTSSN